MQKQDGDGQAILTVIILGTAFAGMPRRGLLGEVRACNAFSLPYCYPVDRAYRPFGALEENGLMAEEGAWAAFIGTSVLFPGLIPTGRLGDHSHYLKGYRRPGKA